MALLFFFFSLFPALPGVITGETQIQNVEECQSGIDCKGREQNLPVCPAGFFCPGGNSSAVPVPCPPGTFRSEGAALPSHRCRPCPVGFFNPRPGQKSCLPCGSEAAQPTEGQHTCVCPGKGQVFQPRDALCTCPPGFRRSGRDGKLCARQSYPVCRDSAWRNQDGQCLTKRGWARYCSHKVCAAPADFRGFDKALGLCLCGWDSLEGLCNPQCRRHQKSTLQLKCAAGKAQLLIKHSDGSKTAVYLEGLRKVLPRPNFSLEDLCAAGEQTHPAHVVEMSEKGFLGVYNPDPQLIHDLVVLNEDSALQEMIPPPAAAPDPPGPEQCRDPGDQSLNPPNSTSQPQFLGILNPTSCISGNVTFVFIISREHFPVYDVNNLYNTNAEFDWGDLRSLGEEIREISRNSQEFFLFLFHFRTPGTYVLRLSSNKHKRMYIRVMPAGGQCYERGPFFPSTPRFAVQAGIGRRTELLLRPDRAAIAGVTAGLLLLLAASLALVLLCRGPGWARRGSARPAFRRQQLRYNLDGFSSKIPVVFAVRKIHPSLQHEAGNSCSAVGTACFPRRGDAWEPEGQIDLEAFDTKVFFELLQGQSQTVTTTLSHFQEEVKALYHKVVNEISSLKKLWIKALSIPGKEEDDESRVAKEQISRSLCPELFQVPLPGSLLENPQTTGFSGLSGASNNPWESIPQKLIPLLQSVLQTLQETRKNNLSPESPGYSSRSTLKASAAHSEMLKSEENQETSPASPALLPSPAPRITHVQQEMQTRFLWEKHSWERAQLEVALLAREMGALCSFYRSSRERRPGTGGLESSAGSLDSLLEELSERHSQAGQALLQRHRDEIQRSGLSAELAVPKQPQHFLEELPHQLEFCLLSLQSPNHDLSQQQKHPREVERSPDSVTRMLQVSGMKIVKLEALSLKCLYRVLDLYSHLQAGSCPGGASGILSRFSRQNRGEDAAQAAAAGREQQQAARAAEFLREHHQEGDLLKGLSTQAEAELSKLRARFRLELRTQTEERLKAKEAEVIQETQGQKFGDFVAYSILSQRHLRQRVTLLQDCHRLRNAALKSQKEGTALEHLVLEDLSMDDDSRDILQLLKDNTEYLFLVLEFLQAARLLQLRETHFKEIIRTLKGCSQEKFVDDANVTTNEVKKFREQKMRKLKEQLRHSLEEKKTETISRSFDPFQSLLKDCTESKSSIGKDFQLDLQEFRRRWGRDKKGKMQQGSPAPPQGPGTQPKAQEQLQLFLTQSTKVLRQAEHLMASRITLLNPQLTAPPLQGDGRKCKNSSFLLGLLREVSDELRSHAEAAGLGQSPRLEKTGMAAQEGELAEVDPAALSPREFVVFQYGLSILQFLTFHIKAPGITLGVASSLPQSPAPGNAFRNSFFYQNSKKKLFILRDCLGSAGGFLLLLVHCLAHVTAGDHDSNPLFLSLFHQALRACLSEMFSLRLQLSAQGKKSQGINQLLLKEDPFSTEEINFISQLFEVRVKSPTDMEAFEKNFLLHVKSEESLNNKWLGKKKENFLHPQSSSGRDSLGQRAQLEQETVNSSSLLELEDKVDALTEELVQIIEDEEQFLNSKGNEDLLFYYLEITTLEKESLVKQINALEEEIARGRKL